VYEWICGERPFHGSFTELCTQHLFANPPSLHDKIPELPFAVEEVVLTALAKDPRERFGSVRAFATAFEQACRPTISHTIAHTPEIATPNIHSPLADTIAGAPPGRLAHPTNTVVPSSQPPYSIDTSIPPTIPAVSPPTSEAKPPIVFLSPNNFSTSFPPATTQPASETILSATNKVSSSLYGTPVLPQLPVPKKHSGWKVAIASVSILLLVALLFILVPYLGRVSNQLTTQGSSRTTSQCSGHGSSPTPRKTSTPLPTKVIYVITDVTNNGQNTGEVVSAVRASDNTTLWHFQLNNESSYNQPVVVDGVVYVSTTHFGIQYADAGIVYALRASDGSTLWTYRVGNSTRGGASVYVSDGLVFISALPDGYEALYVLQANNGTHIPHLFLKENE
jgi:putative pyrroloquinoline-quinone binding quinoprotein